MLVPSHPPWYEPSRVLDRMSTPGAEMSGLSRLLPSTVTGPRDENDAMPSPLLVAPTEKDSP